MINISRVLTNRAAYIRGDTPSLSGVFGEAQFLSKSLASLKLLNIIPNIRGVILLGHSTSKYSGTFIGIISKVGWSALGYENNTFKSAFLATKKFHQLLEYKDG